MIPVDPLCLPHLFFFDNRPVPNRFRCSLHLAVNPPIAAIQPIPLSLQRAILAAVLSVSQFFDFLLFATTCGDRSLALSLLGFHFGGGLKSE